MRFFLDGDGLMPFGRIVKTWRSDFDGGTTLDSWLSLGTTGNDAGSSSAASSLSPGGVRLITGTSSGNTATLKGTAVNLSASNAPVAVRLLVAYHTSGTWSDVRLTLGFEGTASGGWATALASDTQLSLVGRAAGPTDTTQTANFEAHGGGKRYVTSLWLTTGDTTLAVGAGDRVMSHHTFGANLALGSVTPIVRVTTGTAAAREVTVHQIAVERWWA